MVACATSTSEALELVAALEPNLALVDIELGDEDGIALAQQLAVRSPSVRVVLISAYDPGDVDEVIVESRAAGFLPKSRLRAEAIAAFLYWDTSFGIADPDGAARLAPDLGGTVLMGPVDTEHGRISVLTDPSGAVFSRLCSPRDPIPRMSVERKGRNRHRSRFRPR